MLTNSEAGSNNFENYTNPRQKKSQFMPLLLCLVIENDNHEICILRFSNKKIKNNIYNGKLQALRFLYNTKVVICSK